ncbi:MAG: sn-glycerol 3-phosphate transport system substrate-binding protein [Pseudonocardiales bacterium]|nr:sn-glycerol 3-phosphate transport system substrate-binding protein [Pseudonocardiales bacterium]
MRMTRRGTRVPAALAAVALSAVLALAGCSAASSGGGSGPAAVSTEAPGADALNNAGEVDLTFWHAMSGANGDALVNLINQFNAAHQGKIKVNLSFKQQYDDALSAYKTALKGGALPDVMQVYDIGTRFMIDSASIMPIQSFIDKDGYDTSDLQPNIAGYNTVDKKLYSMPFNTSMPLLYINQDAFTRAGLDPNNPPKNLAEIRAAAEKIKATPGETVKFGFGASVYGWFLEQWVASAGQTLCDADNGRAGRPNTVNLATDENVELLSWWQKMVNDGLALKLDSNTDNGDNAFTSGTVAITLESTGSLGGFVKGAKFPIGTGFFPKVRASDAGGPIIGGASLWVVGQGKDAAHERASWELVKFLTSKQSQVSWHTSTGYFPISKSALSDPTDQRWVAQRPQFVTAINQLQQTKLTTATQGCSVGVLPQIRKDVENALQAAVLQNQDPKVALTDAQNAANSQIADYNKSLGG